jgi:hypothetical protein
LRRNESLEAVQAELETAGVPYEIEKGRRNTHYRVRFSGAGGRPKTVVIASSSVNQKAVRDARSTVRRLLRT